MDATVVLVVDDEPQIRRVVRNVLAATTRVIEASTGRDAIDLAAAERPDLVVLDLGLPDMSGLDVCREIRMWSSAPIIVLSARHSDQEKVGLLDAGADDYITKPFSPSELQARVRAQLRRARLVPAAGHGGAITIGDVVIDPVKPMLKRGGTVIHLTKTEWELLRVMLKHAGRTLTHRQLFHAVWGNVFGDALAVLTEDDRRDYEAALGGATRVVRLPNAVPPLGGERARPESKVVVAAGRLNSPQKGFDLLIEAWKPVTAAHPDWQLRIYGRGHLRAALKRQVADAGLADEVFLMGATRDLGAALAQGSVFVLSSRYEGFGIVLVEAMSKGMAVVSFDCPRGPGEIIDDGHDGVLVPNGDVAALSRALLDVVGDEERRRALGAAAVQSARRYDPAVVGKDWVSLIDELAPRVP